MALIEINDSNSHRPFHRLRIGIALTPENSFRPRGYGSAISSSWVKRKKAPKKQPLTERRRQEIYPSDVSLFP